MTIPNATNTDHPPRAPLVLRVGVVGHRPDAQKRPAPDVAVLRTTCQQLLRCIQNTFVGVREAHPDLFAALPPRADGNPSGLRLLSSLAEGADQWVAAEAAQLGYELQVILPFARAEYEKDFVTSSVREEHCRLRELATAVFELDGDRAAPGESYLAAGQVLLNQTDLLIALWDGKGAHGTGGTGQIVHEALQRGIPTLWVHWEAPTHCQLLLAPWQMPQQPSDITDVMKFLAEKVRDLLLPPQRVEDCGC